MGDGDGMDQDDKNQQDKASRRHGFEGTEMIKAGQMTRREIEEYKDTLMRFTEFNAYNEDFYASYSNASMLVKMQLRSSVRIIRFNDEPIFFFWFDIRSYNSVLRSIIPFDKAYEFKDKDFFHMVIPALIESIVPRAESGRYAYQALENEKNTMLLRLMGFSLEESVLVMRIDTKDLPEPDASIEVADFKMEDIQDRVQIQNNVFNDRYRIPLNKSDILIEISKRIYIPEASMFLMKEGKKIGYGQIIKGSEGNYLVNFGIIEERRGQGYSRDFLLYVLNRGKELGFKEIFLEVNAHNIKAVNLYTSIGFEVLRKKDKWIYKDY